MIERIFGCAFVLVLMATALSHSRANAESPQRVMKGCRDVSEANAAYDLLADLMTEIGPRRGGAEAEARARTWAVARLKAFGFANLHVEPFTIPFWSRGVESAAIVSPYPRALRIVGLGNSAATPPGGLTLPVILFPTLDALRQALPDQVRGQIVYVSHAMSVTQDGSGYARGPVGPCRWPCHRRREGGGRLPAITWAEPVTRAACRIDALSRRHRLDPGRGASTIDADDLERVAARGGPVTMHLVLESRRDAVRTCGNVVAEVPGTDPDAGIVLIGAHLDSWDVGTGALDDGAGLAITTMAARRLLASGPHRRTLRLVLFGNEELGAQGAQAYRIAHGNERHALAMESDGGADRIWSLRMILPDSAAALRRRIAEALAPLGIVYRMIPAEAEADIAPMVGAGPPFISLDQSRTQYFNYHHTEEDTLDKVDSGQLAQNRDACTAALRLALDSYKNLVW